MDAKALAQLREPFGPNDIEWRIQSAGRKGDGAIWARAVVYLTSRAIQDRLDEVCGPGDWANEFRAGPAGGIQCGISIRVGDAWVTKWDGAGNQGQTDEDAIKGGYSAAMKRAGCQWGIGRYLYHVESAFVRVHPEGVHYAPNVKLGRGQNAERASFRWDPPALPDWAVPAVRPPAGESTPAGKSQQTTPSPKSPSPKPISHEKSSTPSNADGARNGGNGSSSPKPADPQEAMTAIHARGNELGLTHKEIARWACAYFEVDSMKKLNAEQLRNTYRAVDTGVVAEYLASEAARAKPGSADFVPYHEDPF